MSHACHRFWNARKPSRLPTLDKVNTLRLPRETTSERPKVVQSPVVFNVLASKCAWRHNGVHFLDVSISKSDRAWCALYTLRMQALSHFRTVASLKQQDRSAFQCQWTLSPVLSAMSADLPHRFAAVQQVPGTACPGSEEAVVRGAEPSSHPLWGGQEGAEVRGCGGDRSQLLQVVSQEVGCQPKEGAPDVQSLSGPVDRAPGAGTREITGRKCINRANATQSFASVPQGQGQAHDHRWPQRWSPSTSRSRTRDMGQQPSNAASIRESKNAKRLDQIELLSEVIGQLVKLLSQQQTGTPSQWRALHRHSWLSNAFRSITSMPKH